PGATGYNVKRSTTSGGPYATVGPGVAGPTYIDSGITNGTTYYYVVTALSGGGESTPSSEASARPSASSYLKINAGGSLYAASDGTTFASDASFSGGSPFTYATRAIAGTSDPSLYLDVRYGTAFAYSLPATAGASYSLK